LGTDEVQPQPFIPHQARKAAIAEGGDGLGALIRRKGEGVLETIKDFIGILLRAYHGGRSIGIWGNSKGEKEKIKLTPINERVNLYVGKLSNGGRRLSGRAVNSYRKKIVE